MVTKQKSTGAKEAKKARIHVGKLQLNKETVKGLTRSEIRKIKGGYVEKSGKACVHTK